MTFRISIDLDIKHDPETDTYYINGIEVDETTLNMLLAYQVKPDLKERNKEGEVIFAFTPEFLAFLRTKYYKN